jgi:NhaP-type Na+/H+ or K+/H+ antiporter
MILPPILFADGFNMRRQKFADNIFYILLFGILGTFICFAIMTTLTMLVVSL